MEREEEDETEAKSGASEVGPDAALPASSPEEAASRALLEVVMTLAEDETKAEAPVGASEAGPEVSLPESVSKVASRAWPDALELPAAADAGHERALRKSR